ncbi:DUF892 family protein [Halomarina salina]|uniref:DUF892 family protein n=1 Tax=Halomarina salina TaxID=1872699 RepID=A0ABD5RS46_9EURY
MSVGQKTEHHGIAAYGNPTSLVDDLGYEEAADLLEESLREEGSLEEVTEAGEQFDRQAVTSD